MSLHTKFFATLAAISCIAVTAMVVIAAEPGITPSLAVLMAPYAILFIATATISHGFDLITGQG